MDEIIDDVDCYGLPEYFCEALAKVQQVGPCRRLVFVIHQKGPTGKLHRVGVVKLVLPADELAEIVQQLTADIHGPQPRASRSTLALAN
jgi:hypothetical protein